MNHAVHLCVFTLVSAWMPSLQMLGPQPCHSQNLAKLALAITGSQAAEKPSCAGSCKGSMQEPSKDKVLLCHWPTGSLHLLRPAFLKWEPSGELAAPALNLLLSWGCLPPGRACLCLCFTGFHFNGSNLRMCRCHFYEVGVKKIYSLSQKAFFKKRERERSKGRKVESLWGLCSLPPPHTFCPPPSLCNFIVLCLHWRTKPYWSRTCVSL